MISNTTLKRLFADSGGICAIADCPYANRLPDGVPALEVAHMHSLTGLGPRSDPRATPNELNAYENLILLCPQHHRLIDSHPEAYPSVKLQRIKDLHVKRVAAILESTEKTPEKSTTTNRLQQALKIWKHDRSNDSEEFWHQIFKERPELLGPAVQGRAFTLRSKCYVGGKSVDNHGGNVLDFLAQHNGDVFLIEIKTPRTRLMGGKYRDGVYPPSQELAGAITQGLNYRYSLLNDLHSLRSQEPNLVVHNPPVLVIAGDLGREDMSSAQKRSFQLFRSALKDVIVLTYDELFDGLAHLTVWMESA